MHWRRRPSYDGANRVLRTNRTAVGTCRPYGHLRCMTTEGGRRAVSKAHGVWKTGGVGAAGGNPEHQDVMRSKPDGRPPSARHYGPAAGRIRRTRVWQGNRTQVGNHLRKHLHGMERRSIEIAPPRLRKSKCHAV